MAAETGWSQLTPSPEKIEALRLQPAAAPVETVHRLKFNQPTGLTAMGRFQTRRQAGWPQVHRIAAAVLCMLLLPGTGAAEDGPANSAGAKWNEIDLLQWVATLGEGESQFDELATVAEFERLQASIEEVKQMVLREARTEQEAVEGLRMILKHLTVSTTDSINNDFRNPLFAKADPRNRDIGAYNPDAEYDQAFIDGRYDYKLTAELGTVPYVSITVNGSGKTQLSRAVAYLDNVAIREHTDAEGHFTLWLTKAKPEGPGAWIALPDEANGVIIRQYVTDRAEQTLAQFAIEATGENLPDIEVTSDADIASRLRMASNYLLVSSTWHHTLLPQMRKTPNTFVPSTGASIGASAANSENYYQMAYYEIGEGERLLVDFEAPDTVFWNLTSATIWHESQRYLTDPVSLTSTEATRGANGRVQFVLSREDPAHPNWIKTFGHERGFLILRMVDVKNHPLPIVTHVAAPGANPS
ncbi:MAG: DUF1214 domain-containing protein [Myxococcota bacterium]|nr:DUF1214 domain-containing protein [Myxococcota bacterium]